MSWGNDDDGWGSSGAGGGDGGDESGGGGKTGGDSGCRKCGEEGHFARDCPTGGGGGGGDGKCRNCNQEGHFASDCPEPEKCRRCKEEGHKAADCPLPQKCFNCGEEGHGTTDCPEPVKCRRCKEEGHQVADCPKPQICNRCGGEGHFSRDCTEEFKTRQITTEEGEMREIYVPGEEPSAAELFKSGISTGINFRNYEHIPVKVTGENKPKEIKTFKDAQLRPLILENVQKSGYTVPTPVQKNGIPIIMDDRDMMACAQTGSGKTAAFLLPILHKLMESEAPDSAGETSSKPQCIVVTPTRELARQIYDQARKFAQGSMIKAVVTYGGTSVGYQASQLQKGCNILVATPGRLLDYVEKGRVSFANLQYLVLDEADRMLDMGFMPEIEKCVENPNMPDNESRRTLMFSATFPDEIQEAAQNFLRKDYLFLVVGMIGGACKDVSQTFHKVEKFDKREKLQEILQDADRDPTERTLVFVQTKKNADFLATFLSGEGIPTTSIHGDRLQREREEALYDFRAGTHPVLVATAVAARGLDIPGVMHVINYDMPNEVDEYVHRIGRTGRMGNIGKATSFFDEEQDTDIADALKEMLGKNEVEVPDWLLEIGGGGGGDANGGGDDDDDGWD